MQKNYSFLALAVVLIALLFAGPALAGDKEDTLELVNKGHDYIKANGVEKAVAAFQTDEFKKGDLYLFAYDYDAVCLAQGAKPALVGKNLSQLKTPTGDYLFTALIDTAKNGGGWYEYQWMHPYDKKLKDKVSYIKPIEGMDAFIGCGYWK